MTREQIAAARHEALRFIERCDAASNALVWRKFNDGSNRGYWCNENTKATGALRRASMDLTRSLADLRRPRT